MTIKAHYDGKVFVPDEPVKLTKGRAVTVKPKKKVRRGMTGRQILEYLDKHPSIKKYWDEIAAGRDSTEVADELRRLSQTRRPSHEAD